MNKSRPNPIWRSGSDSPQILSIKELLLSGVLMMCAVSLLGGSLMAIGAILEYVGTPRAVFETVKVYGGLLAYSTVVTWPAVILGALCFRFAALRGFGGWATTATIGAVNAGLFLMPFRGFVIEHYGSGTIFLMAHGALGGTLFWVIVSLKTTQIARTKPAQTQ